MKNIVILIGGGSASGKTLLAQELIKKLDKSVTYVPVDMYCLAYPWMSLEERSNLNYDHPDAYNHELLYKQLLDLKSNKDIEMPIYDFKTHDNFKETRTVHPNRIIIVDGILTLYYKELLNVADFKIYMDTEESIRLERRIKRDTVERGRTKESVIEQFNKTVKPMHDLFIEPSKNNADFIFINNGNTGLDQKVINKIIEEINLKLEK